MMGITVDEAVEWFNNETSFSERQEFMDDAEWTYKVVFEDVQEYIENTATEEERASILADLKVEDSTISTLVKHFKMFGIASMLDELNDMMKQEGVVINSNLWSDHLQNPVNDVQIQDYHGRLVAAAPELLEMARRFKDYLEQDKALCDCGHSECKSTQLIELIATVEDEK